jgi:hypothetical protein
MDDKRRDLGIPGGLEDPFNVVPNGLNIWDAASVHRLKNALLNVKEEENATRFCYNFVCTFRGAEDGSGHGVIGDGKLVLWSIYFIYLTF